jgi:hypothetical protein
VFLPAAHRGTAVEVSGGTRAVLTAIEAVPVVHGDLDLRSSFASLPRIHALVLSRPPIDGYFPAAEAPRGALVDRYV